MLLFMPYLVEIDEKIHLPVKIFHPYKASYCKKYYWYEFEDFPLTTFEKTMSVQRAFPKIMSLKGSITSKKVKISEMISLFCLVAG